MNIKILIIYVNFDVVRLKNIKICNIIKIYMIFANVIVIRLKNIKIYDIIKIYMIFANVVVVRFKNIKICDIIKIYIIFANIVVVRSQLLIHISSSKFQIYLIYFQIEICINNHQNLLSYKSITFSDSVLFNVSSYFIIVYYLISYIKAF